MMKLVKEDIYTRSWIFATGIVAISIKHKVRNNIWNRSADPAPDDVRIDIKVKLGEISY